MLLALGWIRPFAGKMGENQWGKLLTKYLSRGRLSCSQATTLDLLQILLIPTFAENGLREEDSRRYQYHMLVWIRYFDLKAF